MFWRGVGGARFERMPAGKMGRIYRLIRYGGRVNLSAEVEMDRTKISSPGPPRDLKLETMSVSPCKPSP